VEILVVATLKVVSTEELRKKGRNACPEKTLSNDGLAAEVRSRQKVFEW
jgi:hypothetical protein